MIPILEGFFAHFLGIEMTQIIQQHFLTLIIGLFVIISAVRLKFFEYNLTM